MLIEVKVPVLSESIADGTLVRWHKKVGEFVRRDENLIDLETDKVVLEIVAPSDGVIKKISKADGALVVSDEVIATIDSEAKASVSGAAAAQDKVPVLVSDSATVHTESADVLLSPAARKLVAEKNIDPTRVAGTGRDHRVTKADIVHYLETRGGGREEVEETVVSSPVERSLPIPESVPSSVVAGQRVEKRVPMSRLRARVAERLKEAQNTAAILTTFNEVNMQPVMSMRKKYKELFEKQHGARLGFMSFFTKAVTEALKQFPVINASVDGKDIVYHGYFDIGIAIGSPRGLVVPILRDVDQMSFADIEKGIAEFGGKAKEGKLSLDDLTGGTFSITNGGTFGSMLSTPILNPPQSAILGMHNIQERAMVENGEVVVLPMMYVALSYDHRIIDGHEAVLFLVAIKNALEDPARLLLEL
ncbi:MAG: 2-oxoglutarate dehydrogenase complex dihydrolipoyllysine-residue succinyltransferase [Ectothiorhodospiraceae bacterium]|nr:2-oxoglutarate dehydrogenase complex dihydrolipoyllysine-residue succinyltransferase [Ectothiorhodospiraceae bacterium]